MYVDKQLEFSNEQAVTATADSTNYVDVGHAYDIGPGAQDLEMIIIVDEAVTASGAATVTFKLETDDNTSFSSATDLYTSAAIGKATLVAGYRAVHARIPVSGVERYLQVSYTVASGPLTAGKFTAFLAPYGQTNKNDLPN